MSAQYKPENEQPDAEAPVNETDAERKRREKDEERKREAERKGTPYVSREDAPDA